MRLKNIKLVFTLFFLSSIVVLTQANECKTKLSRSGQCNPANRFSFCELKDNSRRKGVPCGDNGCFCHDE